VGVIASKAADVVAKNLRRVTAIAVGPGFGLEDTTKEFLNLLIGGTMRAGRLGIGFVQNKEKLDEMAKVTLPPLVIDADGLKLLARLQNWPERIPAPAVLTPHPGEMAILSGLDIDEIQSDRVSVAERFAAQWKHVVVLKGACTVVASPEGDTAVVPVSTAALARAGTGDVLTGLIVGLLAQGVAAYPAAIAGAWLHAQAGVLAEVVLGNSASVLAGDVLDAVPDILSDLS
jgi:NAD(P)H-hydrate epimerase